MLRNPSKYIIAISFSREIGKARKTIRSFLSKEYEFLRVVNRKYLSELVRRRFGLIWIDCTFSAVGHVVVLNAYKRSLFLGNGAIMFLEEDDDIEEILKSLEMKMGHVFLIVRKSTLNMSKSARKKETSRRTTVRFTIYVVNLEEMCLILVESLIVCVCCS